MMMVVFQNKIIYMPGMPPGARREKIDDYRKLCRGIEWREERIVSADNTKLVLCVADVVTGRGSGQSTIAGGSDSKSRIEEAPVPVYVLYFQGSY